MHKSLFIFGLLGSSLVMLAVMPLLNNNTVAMAQEYDKYRDNGYYSQYPTDDKKYECRTGPFEGFFVSSVEFCKHIKFDDKDDRKDIRDNRTGTQGPAGHRSSRSAVLGPQGIQGIPGPAGITQLNSSNVYQVISNVTEYSQQYRMSTVTILCDPGDIVINGGYNHSSFGFL